MKQHLIFLTILLITICACKPTTKNEQPQEEQADKVETPALPQEDKEAKQHNEEASPIEEPQNPPSEEKGYYICYKGDDKPSLQFVVYYNDDGDAQSVRYKGQSEKMDLKFVERAIIDEGQAPYILKYDEMYKGEVNGRYEFTHSGNWDYAKYIRQDGKVFNFTFMAEVSYKEEPCF